MGQMELFGAYALGKPITLYCGNLKRMVSGFIQGINCESGYAHKSSPDQFIVTIREVDQNIGVYIKTVD